MDRESAIRKVRACLRLSKSANMAEAASALRQAKALMARYGLDESDTSVDEINSTTANTRSRGGDIPLHVWSLAALVGNAFQCMAVQAYHQRMTVVRYFGHRTQPTIAAYAFAVLRRQLDESVKRHVARVRKRKNRQERSEAFGLGWVRSVRSLLNVPPLPELEVAKLTEWASGQGMGITTDAPQSLSHVKPNDFLAGHIAGRKAKLHSGIEGAKQAQLEHAR